MPMRSRALHPVTLIPCKVAAMIQFLRGGRGCVKPSDPTTWFQWSRATALQVPGLHATGALKLNGCFAVAGWQSSTMFGIIFAPMESLIYQETPIVHLAGNTFVNVPTVLQYDQTPLIQVLRAAEAGFTTEIPIYHSDGTYLAKVVGSQIYPTADGKKAGVTLRHPEHATVCELDGKTIFELIRQDAAALKTRAELYTPDGSFIKCADDNLAASPTSRIKAAARPACSGFSISGAEQSARKPRRSSAVRNLCR
jgi:hypothetical protein